MRMKIGQQPLDLFRQRHIGQRIVGLITRKDVVVLPDASHILDHGYGG